MGDLLNAFGPAGAFITVSGSILLFVISDRKQTRSNLKHLAFLHIKQSTQMVQYCNMPLSVLLEDIKDLEEFLEGSEHSDLLTTLVKAVT